ncbi:MAG: glucose 1-dehydrogenase [Deltaproteobacteria bacterium]|nr:glucose 1-dehydrogenase [Candidatus Zymogenaceae bacterium]
MYIDKLKLKGKTAVITGGSRGIGREIALAFAEMGANVVVAGRKLPDLERAAEDIAAAGGTGLAVAAHAGKTGDLENLVQATVDRFGTIDILVNNAAVNPVFGPIESIDEALFSKMMDVNVKGYLMLARMAMPHMEKAGGGSIINIASVEGFKPSYGTGLYSVTKAAVVMLTKVLALEWAAKKIRVNCIAPGLVRTHFSEFLWKNEEILKLYLEHCPIKRIGQPYEIAGLALFLASELAGYTTGSVFTADGGYLI